MKRLPSQPDPPRVDRRSHQSYTDARRLRALAVLRENRLNLSRTARELSIPRKTLSYWLRGIGVEGQPVEPLVRPQSDAEMIARSRAFGSRLANRPGYSARELRDEIARHRLPSRGAPASARARGQRAVPLSSRLQGRSTRQEALREYELGRKLLRLNRPPQRREKSFFELILSESGARG